MFPRWRLKIREAQQALQQGRWEDASALLQRESVREFLPAKRLSREVASRLVDRAQERLQGGDSCLGWRDLEQAARLGGCEEQISQLRDLHARSGINRIRHLLLAGETELAANQIAKLEQRRVGGEDRRVWKSIVKLVSRANKLAVRGEPAEASRLLAQAEMLLPHPDHELSEQITSRRDKLSAQAIELKELTKQLHESLVSQEWTQVLTAAQSMLESAPEHPAALEARRKAWQAVGLQTTKYYRRSPSLMPAAWRNPKPYAGRKSTHASIKSAESDTNAMKRDQGRRLVAWIDSVGGYLVCLGDEVVLGQPAGGGGADIPLLADLSRRHALIRREGEAYILTPIHDVSVNQQSQRSPTVLRDDDVIQLGSAVRLRFKKPHALSATAVLKIESHHKTEPAVDGIVLMSDCCILGSQKHSHVPCRGWQQDVILFRRGDQLQIRSTAELEIEGDLSPSETVIQGNCRVTGEDFALSFEEL